MRVLLDCRMASWTGVGRYSVGLVRALGRRRDLEIVLVLAAGEAPPVSAVETHVAEHHPFLLAGSKELGGIVADVRPDVTHCLHFPTPSPARHPLVVTLHDLSPLRVPGIMPSLAKRIVYRYSNSRAVARADGICVPSQFTADEIAQVFPAAARKTHVTLEAADDFSAGRMGPLDPELAALAEHPYVLSMGSTRPHKDLPTLLKAFAPLAVQDPELRLLLVGTADPEYVDGVLPDAAAAVRERIVFTGRIGDAELRTLMSNAAVFAFPSRYEGFGLPPLEAMSLGAPVVCADAASLPEVVGDAAELVAPGDVAAFSEALGRVLGDAGLREQLVASGRARAAGFTWARTAEETVAVYHQVASGSRPTDGAGA